MSLCLSFYMSLNLTLYLSSCSPLHSLACLGRNPGKPRFGLETRPTRRNVGPHKKFRQKAHCLAARIRDPTSFSNHPGRLSLSLKQPIEDEFRYRREPVLPLPFSGFFADFLSSRLHLPPFFSRASKRQVPAGLACQRAARSLFS